MSAPQLSQRLASGLQVLGLSLTGAQQASLLAFLDLLARWNKVYNLTALRDPQQMLTHHLLDCLAVVGPLRRHTGGASARVLDVGSGGGLPGVVLAISCPELEVVCVDAVAKKAAFVQQAAGQLDLSRLSGLHARVEGVTQRFDVVASRAFASLAEFTAGSAEALGAGGVWMAMKGKRPDEEVAALPESIDVFHVEPLEVPGLDAERHLVWMRPASRLDGG